MYVGCKRYIGYFYVFHSFFGGGGKIDTDVKVLVDQSCPTLKSDPLQPLGLQLLCPWVSQARKLE